MQVLTGDAVNPADAARSSLIVFLIRIFFSWQKPHLQLTCQKTEEAPDQTQTQWRQGTLFHQVQCCFKSPRVYEYHEMFRIQEIFSSETDSEIIECQSRHVK